MQNRSVTSSIPVNKRRSGKYKAADKEKQTFILFMKRHWAAIFIFLLCLFVSFPYDKNGGFETYPKAGEVSKETIIAPFSFDVVKTEQEISAEKERLSQKILPIFRYDSTAVERMSDAVDTLITAINNCINLPKTDTTRAKHLKTVDSYVSPSSHIFIENPQILSDFKERLISAGKKGLTNKIVAISDLEGEHLQKQYNTKEQYVRSASGFIEILSGNEQNSSLRAVSTDSVQSIFEFRSRIARDLSANYSKNEGGLTPKEISSAIFALSGKVAAASLVYEGEMHANNLSAAFSLVSNIKETIIKDVAIVRQHQLVTSEISRVLETLRQEKIQRQGSVRMFRVVVDTAIIFILILAFAVLIIFHIGRYIPQFLTSQKYFLSLSIICSIQFLLVWITRVIVNAFYAQQNNLPFDAANRLSEILCWGPMFTAPLLASLLFRRQTGFLISIFFAIYFCLISQFSVALAFSVLIIGGFVSFYAQKIRYRKHLLWMIAFMVAANIFLEFVINLVSNAVAPKAFLPIFAAPFLNVTISAVVMYFSLPLFENLFAITTVTTLLELADMSSPLLKRLAVEAPGTFNHSLAVGNLAELAAEKVGANPLLCRVFAYYHDVGKIKNPAYFTENQLDRGNPHDKLPPARSARIIISHIRDGCDLIDEYKIPKVIKNGIIQHHGTGLVGSFYQKALDQKKENETINPEDYSYPGEKPQIKETAVLMLADKIEAMSKSLKGESESDLRKKIQDNVRKIVVSGQLDECGLTFRNVFEIVNSVMPALKGIFHERIEYPEEGKNGKE